MGKARGKSQMGLMVKECRIGQMINKNERLYIDVQNVCNNSERPTEILSETKKYGNDLKNHRIWLKF